jgi:hypothetical protein|tara:strand:+ start:695 stop:991 length:297 start_codon:yes stop_codon:yes gene_type:complete
MKVGISVRIDMKKIDESRLYEGAKGTYLDLTTFVDTEIADKYDNHGFISQSQSKQELEAGQERTPILGNCKVFWSDGAQKPAPQATPIKELPDDDIPF